MARKTLPPQYKSWATLYDEVVSKHPEVLKCRRIVLKWVSPSQMGNTTDIIEPNTFSIYLDTLKKRCFEEILENNEKV